MKEFIKGLTGGTDLKMEEVFTPTCTICGLTSGYQGPGSKTVQPAIALRQGGFPPRPRPEARGHPQETARPPRRAGLRRCADQISGWRTRPLGRIQTTPSSEPWCRASEEVYEEPMQLVPMVGGSGPNYPFVHDLGSARSPRRDWATPTPAPMRPTRTSASTCISNMPCTWRA
ncbi:MAG: hypothetical protein MZV70_21285 [Desulfobacterales bacterium]|nr:hypothetical protein [Desulfobacterales bacterium]